MPGSEWFIVIVNIITATAIIPIIIITVILLIILKLNRVFYYLAFKRIEKDYSGSK